MAPGDSSEDIPEDPHGSDAPELTHQDSSVQSKARGPLVSRRRVLVAMGGAAATAAIGTSQDLGGDEGKLSAGTANLEEAYHVAGGLYIGPESAKGTVDPKAGRYYLASDTDKEFYGDGGSWNWKGVNAPAVHTEQLSTRAKTHNYHIWKSSGGTVYAAGDGTTVRPDFSGGDFLSVLKDCINALPSPDSQAKQAYGTIHIGHGPFVADLTSQSSVRIKEGLNIIGDEPDHQTGGVGQSGMNSRIECQGGDALFVPPDVDGSYLKRPSVQNLAIEGPGVDVSGSRAIDDRNSSNTLDLFLLRNCYIRYFEENVKIPGADSPWFVSNHIYKSGGDCVTDGNSGSFHINNEYFDAGQNSSIGYTPAVLKLSGSMIGGLVMGNPLGSGISGSASARVLGTTFGSFDLQDRIVSSAGVVSNCHVISTTNVTTQIDCNVDGMIVANNRLTGNASDYDIQVNASDVIVQGNYPEKDLVVNRTGNQTRFVRNGMGRNAGDPNSTGQWNGNGYEGVTVRDTTNANTYIYNNGSWSQIASA